MRKNTKNIEAVETANIAQCLRRVLNSPGATNRKTKRTFFNAWQMLGIHNDVELANVRVALQLP